MYILSQFIGCFALLFSCLGIWQRNKDRLLNYQIIEVLLTSISNFLLQATSGMICSLIALFRNVFCRFKINQRIVLLVTVLLSLLYSIFFVRNIIDLLPMLAVMIYSFSIIFSKRLTSIRVAAFISSVFLLIYNLLFLNILSSIKHLISISNAFMSILKRKDE